jgi:hypothetical protein
MESSTEAATLAAAVDLLTAGGFTEHFTLAPGGLQALTTGQIFTADQVVLAEYHRFEGASDPGDMSIVYAVETRSGVRGTLVDAFGVYADPRMGAFVAAGGLRRVRPPAPREG